MVEVVVPVITLWLPGLKYDVIPAFVPVVPFWPVIPCEPVDPLAPVNPENP